jgi:hypothetical protein
MARKPVSSLGVSFVSLLLILVSSSTYAVDPNGYTAEYECRAGGSRCPVDVVALGARACDQTITASTPWSAINWANNTICIQAGDHVAKGTLTIPANANGTGTDSNFKVLRYTRAGDDNDEPWLAQQLAGTQARLERLVVEGDFWLIHRLTFPNVSGVAERILFFATTGNDVRDVIINRVLVEGGGAGTGFHGISTDGEHGPSDYQGLSIQNSVLRNVGPLAPETESIGISLHVGRSDIDSRYYIVNNELHDWVSHLIQIGRDQLPIIPGIVVENNDLYVSPALHQPNGTAASESPLSIKVKGSEQFPTRVMHNRIWGARSTAMDLCCTGERGGQAITTYSTLEYLLIQNNVIGESNIGSFPTDNSSWIGNIFYSIKKYFDCGNDCNSHVLQWGGAANEVYLNTVIDNPSYSFSTGVAPNLDIRCNTLISAADRDPTGGGPSGSAVIDDNVFYDSPTLHANGVDNNIVSGIRTRENGATYSVGEIIRTGPVNSCGAENDSSCYLYRVTAAGTSSGVSYCAELGCTTTDGGMSVQAVRGPYKVWRKLKTGPEPKIIPYAAVHTSAAEAAFCPSGTGSSPNIGINGDTLGNGILAADLTGTTRVRTAGALQASGGGSQPPPGSSPYPGPNPAPIPGTIEAENFDNGAAGVAYSDVDAGNNGGAYRNTDVDVAADQGASNQNMLGWARTGEWLNYTVDVMEAGNYTLEIGVAANGVGGTFHIEFGGADKTGPIQVPDTGGWFTWQPVSRTVSLSAGRQTMRLVMDSVSPVTGSTGDFDYFRLTPGSAPSATYVSDLPFTSATNGWGPVERDRSNGELAGGDGHPITLNGTVYNKGLGVHAYSEVRVSLGGQYARFLSDVGVDDETGTSGSVQFEVWADGTRLYQSPVMFSSTPTQTVNVDVSGRQELVLIVKDGGDGVDSDHGDWAGARLVPSGSAPPPPTGTILREHWAGIAGVTVASLTSHPNYPNNPTGSEQLTLFEAPTDWADNYGTRIRGFVHAFASGNYIFWIAGDDESELWLSTDANPGNKVRIAFLNGWTFSRQWDKYATQQSIPITLTAGQRYYIEALQKEGGGGDNLAVGWQLPNGTFEGPIPGSRLSPAP